MGLYNSVYVACPGCGNDVELQSKAVDGFQQFFPDNGDLVPKPIADDLKGETAYCHTCHSTYTVYVVPEVITKYLFFLR